MFLGSVLDCVIGQDIWDIGMGSLVRCQFVSVSTDKGLHCLIICYCHALVKRGQSKGYAFCS